MKLKDIVKLAHSKVVKSDMKAPEKASLTTLLKSASFKLIKKEHADSEKVKLNRTEKIESQKFSDPEVKNMMKEAMLDIQNKDIELQKMKSKISSLEKDSKELKTLQNKQHEDRVEGIVKTEHKLGIVSEEGVADKTEIYKKLHSEDLGKIEKMLEGKKPLTKAQKMSELGDEADTDVIEARRKLFAQANINVDPSEIEGDIIVQD